MSDAPIATTALEFDPASLIIDDDTDIRQGLSAVAVHEQDLCDGVHNHG